MTEPTGDGLILFIVTILMLILSWLAVIARYAIRYKKRILGLDDWLMFAGLILFTATSALIITICFYGAGYPSDQLDAYDIMMGTKLYFVAQIVYVACTVPVKLSICVALLRITSINRTFSYTLYGVAGLSIASAIIVIAVIANVCRPAPALWGEAEGTCNYALNSGIGYFLSAVSIITDWTLAILPAFMLYNVQLKRSVKVSVATVLALGAFASSATIVRLRFLVLYENAAEFMYSVAKIAVWSILEEGIGITAGSMPMLRPLLRHVPFFSSGGHTSSYEGNTAGFRSTARRTERMELDTNVARATGPGREGKNSDGDSQRHILKETEFTVTSESCGGLEQRSWKYDRVNEYNGRIVPTR